MPKNAIYSVSLKDFILLFALLTLTIATEEAHALTNENRSFALPHSIYMGFFDNHILDNDKDGLKDDYENMLADVWRPAFIFDEEENSTQHFEPVVLFRVYPPKDWVPERWPKIITIKYAFLWAKDGGYVGSPWWVTNAHWGDNGSGSYELVSWNGVDWRLNKLILWDGYGALWANNPRIEWTKKRNTYWGKMAQRPSPIIHISSGKHHRYISKSECENAGAWHGFKDEDCDEGGTRYAQLTKDWAFNNVGEPQHHSQSEGVNRPFLNDLSPFGYDKEYVWWSRWECYCDDSNIKKDCFTGGIGNDWPGGLACEKPDPVYQLIAKHGLPGKKIGPAQKDVAVLLTIL